MLNLLPPQAISLEAAEAALRSQDFFVRYTAARLLGRRGDRDARLVLQTVIAEGDAPARASAARELHGFSWFAAEPIVRQALSDSDSRVREGAVYALCDMRDLNAYRLLAETLRDETDNVRAAAAWGLRERRDPAAVPVLEVVASRAADPDVRVMALEALGANETSEALLVVRAAMNDPVPEVKYAAVLSWLELAGEACLSEVSGVIQSTSGASRQHILRAFFHATNYLQIDVARSSAVDSVIGALGAALQDPLSEVRRAAAWPLAWIQDDRAALMLKEAYHREPDDETKAHFVRVAVGLMSPVAGAILQDALNDPSERVREMAELMRLASLQHRIDESLPPGVGPIWKR